MILPRHGPGPVSASEGVRAALLFALVSDRLNAYYDTGRWPGEREGTQRAADWADRAGSAIPGRELRCLVAESDRLARDIEGALSREAGLCTAHEMNESLDPNYRSEIGQSLMDECRRRIAAIDRAEGEAP